MALALIALSFGISCVLTGLVRRYAIRSNILDHPNERSSHSVPTPRGGGVAIVAAVVIVAVLARWNGNADTAFSILLGVSVLVALVGFVDDHICVFYLHHCLIGQCIFTSNSWIKFDQSIRRFVNAKYI